MPAREHQLRTWMVDGLDGDADAHATLLRALIPVLRAFYRNRIGDDNAIEDLVQETLIAVHSRRMSYDPDRPFAAWLFAIARYKMIDHLRRQRPTCPIDDVAEVLMSEAFEDQTNARLDVDRLLAALPQKQAGLIRKTRIEGESVAATACGAAIGESNVKVSVHRGLKALAALVRGGRS